MIVLFFYNEEFDLWVFDSIYFFILKKNFKICINFKQIVNNGISISNISSNQIHNQNLKWQIYPLYHFFFFFLRINCRHLKACFPIKLTIKSKSERKNIPFMHLQGSSLFIKLHIHYRLKKIAWIMYCIKCWIIERYDYE